MDKNDEIIICDKKRMSAARFVGIHGDRAVSNSMKSYYDKPVPEIGKIYLINETNEIGEQGSPGRPERLICRPKQYSGYKGCFLLCEYFTAPDRPWHRSFLVEDFRKGLIRIQELKDYIYVNFMNGPYSWTDLDIDHPHPDIKKLYK